MIREERFLSSHRPYAVDLSSLRIRDRGPTEVDAVWFRRRNGVTAACLGTLWDFLSPPPVDALEFVRRHTDGRHGGRCEGRWDGENYWGAQQPEMIYRHLNLLRPMLANYSEIPNGWDGWWAFRVPEVQP